MKYFIQGFPGGSDGKESACNAEDLGSSPGLGRSPGEGSGTPLQYYCLENPVDRGAWQATVYGVAKSRTQLSNFTFAAKDGEALYRQQKQDQELTVAQIMNSFLPNPDLN